MRRYGCLKVVRQHEDGRDGKSMIHNAVFFLLQSRSAEMLVSLTTTTTTILQLLQTEVGTTSQHEEDYILDDNEDDEDNRLQWLLYLSFLSSCCWFLEYVRTTARWTSFVCPAHCCHVCVSVLSLLLLGSWMMLLIFSKVRQIHTCGWHRFLRTESINHFPGSSFGKFVSTNDEVPSDHSDEYVCIHPSFYRREVQTYEKNTATAE